MKVTKQTLDIINTCVNKNIPVLLRGETGVGKTTIIRTIAENNEQQLVRINLNGQTSREDLIGKYVLKDDSTVWQDGVLLTAMKKGYWILLDEINAALPEVLLVLQAMLEKTKDGLGSILLTEKDGELVAPHQNTRIFATCNPSEYGGVKDFNQATLSRFIVIDISCLNPDKEEALLMEKFPQVKPTVITKLVKLGHELRTMKYKQDVFTFVSTRDLEQCLELIDCGIKPGEAVRTVIAGKTQSEADMEIFRQAINKEFKTAKGPVSFQKMLERYEQLSHVEGMFKHLDQLSASVQKVQKLNPTK